MNKQRFLSGIALSIAVPALAACGGGADAHSGGTHTSTTTTSTAAATEGVLEGRFLMVGGPYPGLARPISGTVFVDDGTHHIVVHVGKDGRYHVSVPIGTYRLSGSSAAMNGGKDRCREFHAVTIHAQQTAHANTRCIVP